ncbi:MAG: hypothetical protein ACFFEF_00925 [Candidatus Thorarchaeota archaeon]
METPGILLAGVQSIRIVLLWFCVGIITAPFARSEWNQVRSLVYVGVILGILSLSGMLLQDPSFWAMADRNYVLLLMFVSGTVSSLISLIAALPLVLAFKQIRKSADIAPPDGIETVCECGTVFKSKPMLCAVCGRILIESPSLSTDAASE